MAKMGAFKTDEGVLDEWGKIANGTHPMDHAVGIIVSDNLTAKIIDNGCGNGGIKDFSMINLVDRLEDVNVCYKFDLVEE